MVYLAEQAFRALVWLQFRRNAAARDRVTDYLDADPVDFAGAWRAYSELRDWNRGKVSPELARALVGLAELGRGRENDTFTARAR